MASAAFGCKTVVAVRPIFLRAASARNLSVTAAYKNVKPVEASEMMKNGTRYLDVRTTEEFGGGRPPKSINIPVLGAGMIPNAKFGAQVSAAFADKTESIIVVSSDNYDSVRLLAGCKSGRRSLTAIQILTQEGYINLINQEGGWDGWVSSGLPVEK